MLLGLIWVWSIVSRAGGATPEIGIVPPVFEQPFTTGGAEALITLVADDVARVVPALFLAVTRTRMAFPRSTDFRT